MNVERRRLFKVKRAQTNEVVAALVQRHVRPDEARDVDASVDFPNNALVDTHDDEGSSFDASEQSP